MNPAQLSKLCLGHLPAIVPRLIALFLLAGADVALGQPASPPSPPVYADKPGAGLPTEELVDDPAIEEPEKKTKSKASGAALNPVVISAPRVNTGAMGEKPITDGVYLQALDKVTARVTRLELALGTPVQFGTLRLVARACAMRPPEETPESSVFLEIDDLKAAPKSGTIVPVQPVAGPSVTIPVVPASAVPAGPRRVFSGWMFASNPSISALEHPVYDVWVTSCRIAVGPAPTGKR